MMPLPDPATPEPWSTTGATECTGLVLAAGRGTRMRSAIPKVLHPVCGLPLVAHPLRALARAGARETVVVIGHGAAAVESACREEFPSGGLRFARQEPPRGTGDAVRTGLGALADRSGTLLIVNGDLPCLRPETLGELIAYHREVGAAMTILSLRLEEPHGYGRLVRNRSGGIARVVEEKDATSEERAIREVNGGLYAVELAALRPALEEWCSREEQRIARGGAGPSEIYFPPIIEPIATAGGVVADWSLPADRVDELQQVNDRVDLAAASALVGRRTIEGHQRAGVTVVDPGQTWIECDVEIGADTTIHPGCVLRRGVRIGRDCEVGPHAHLREGTVLEDDVQIGNYVEVKKTRIGRGSRSKHLTYLGDGEIGERVNIGAGTVLANYDGRKKSTTRIADDVFVGSGTIIVAPASLGPGARTGAGAVVTRGQEVPPGETVIGVPARPLRRPGGDDETPRRPAGPPSER